MDSGIEIISTGSYVPLKKVTNDDMSLIVDTSDSWITTRTGIKERHFVTDENTIDLAYKASLKAIKNIDKSQIGIVIVASISSPYNMPSISCLLQEKLGLDNDILAFDLNAACSGFIYALSVARSLLLTSEKPYALIVGSEALSKILDFKDRSTCILFGDGAGSVVIKKSSSLFIEDHFTQSNTHALYCKSDGYINMEGQEVFRFAVNALSDCINNLLNKSHLSQDDIDYFIVHQANKRIIAHVYKKLKIDQEKFYINLDKYGNTSSASIPLVLDEMNDQGLLRKGMKIILVGFGGGLTYGGNLIEW